MATVVVRAYNGDLGQIHQQGPCVKPPEAERLLVFGCPMEVANLVYSSYFTPSVNRKVKTVQFVQQEQQKLSYLPAKT